MPGGARARRDDPSPTPFGDFMRSAIIGTGSYAPSRVVTNDEIATLVDTSDEWIRTRTGIRTRHLVESEGSETTVDMSEQASLQALKDAQVFPEELDMIIVGTVTPDYRLPSAACLLQNRLGAKRAVAFDVLAACAGSIYGLSIADQFLRTKTHQKVLVVGAECLSTITNWTDRNTCVLFGDMASAAVMAEGNDDSGFVDIQLYTDGSHWKHIWIEAGGSNAPMTPNHLARKADRMVMNGREVYKFAVRALTRAAKRILDQAGINKDEVDHVVAHQANLRIIETVADRTKIPLDKFIINIDRYANTSSASLLATFDEGRCEGRFKKGDTILMLSIGSGFTWGAGIYQV